MLKFDASTFVYCTANLIKYWLGLSKSATLTDEGMKQLAGSLFELQRECERHGFRSSLNQLRRIREYIDAGNVTNPGLSQLLGETVVRLEEDLQGEMFLAVASSRASYYESTEPLFGKEVADAFPSTAYDVAEAGKCYALYRSTACVFHLMRVVEIGLRVFADRFGVKSDRQNWQNIIEGIEKAVRNIGTDPATRPSNWKDQQEFFSGAATHFMFIKDAWRNYVTHGRDKSTEEEAEKILGNVRGFMQRLAIRLHE
jgi:hypothetical protein